MICYNTSRCVGCGTCLSMCPFGSIDNPSDVCEINQATCMCCGVCVDSCPIGAIEEQ